MNYIAHINLAEHTETSALGNFLGDFVKGDLYSWTRDGHNETLPDVLLKGIRLHRSVDNYTDSHNTNQYLRALFPKPLRRMSGIILDVYFDHLLCQHWSRFNNI